MKASSTEIIEKITELPNALALTDIEMNATFSIIFFWVRRYEQNKCIEYSKNCEIKVNKISVTPVLIKKLNILETL